MLGLTVEGPCGGTRHKVVRETIYRLSQGTGVEIYV